MLTLTDAAEQVGKSKSTLVRAIKSGKLSAQRNEHGDYRVEPSELYRVYKAMTNDDESNDALPMVSDLLDMVKGRDSELADVRAELDETKARLTEHREAARSLMSPEEFDKQLTDALATERADQELKETEWVEQAAQLKQQHNKALETEREQQAKVLAKQKQSEAQQAEKWQKAIADRQLEIQQARTESDEIRQREADQAKELKAERDRVTALESRSFIARLLNKKPSPVG